MPATKVTLLFQGGTIDSAGNAARVAGWSETYYSTLAIDAPQLSANWTQLCTKRAALLPTNSRIVGSRYQRVDPIGGSRQFDNTYVGAAGTPNDLPGLALQWTVRSPATPNQKNVILRSIPDIRIVTGEYSPSPAYDAALLTFFNELTTNWQFRAIDRTVLPVKIIDITGAGVMRTISPHGLVIGDRCNIMSTRPDTVHKSSYEAIVIELNSPTTATIVRADAGLLQSAVGGRVRKLLRIYPNISITVGEVIAPTAITRKVGAPFKKFRGRRTGNRV